MPQRPRDLDDLYLAPVALDIDRRLEELSGYSAEDLQFRMILATDREPQNAAERQEALFKILTSDLELHGWQIARHPRGLLLAHDAHSLVLGMPSNLMSYLRAGAAP